MREEHGKNKIRIVVADGHTVVRYGLSMLIRAESDLELAGEAKCFDEALYLLPRLEPDVLLFELSLAKEAITDCVSKLANTRHALKILIFTGNTDHDAHIHALRAGAAGILTKNQSNDLLLKAIRGVHSGEMWVDRSITAVLLKQPNPPSPSFGGPMSAAPLTPREADIARLSAQGLTSKKIAEKLHISEKTVRNQLTVIYSKLGVSNQLDLVIRASSIGL